MVHVARTPSVASARSVTQTKPNRSSNNSNQPSKLPGDSTATRPNRKNSKQNRKRSASEHASGRGSGSEATDGAGSGAVIAPSFDPTHANQPSPAFSSAVSQGTERADRVSMSSASRVSVTPHRPTQPPPSPRYGPKNPMNPMNPKQAVVSVTGLARAGSVKTSKPLKSSESSRLPQDISSSESSPISVSNESNPSLNGQKHVSNNNMKGSGTFSGTTGTTGINRVNSNGISVGSGSGGSVRKARNLRSKGITPLKHPGLQKNRMNKKIVKATNETSGGGGHHGISVTSTNRPSRPASRNSIHINRGVNIINTVSGPSGPVNGHGKNKNSNLIVQVLDRTSVRSPRWNSKKN